MSTVQSAPRSGPQHRLAHEQQRITAGVKSGQLTQAEATALQSRLDAFETGGRGKAFKKQLRGLDREITRDLSNTDIDAGKRLEALKATITTGLADGTLTANEAAPLLAKAVALEGELSNTGVSSPTLAGKVGDLAKEISAQRRNRVVDTQHAVEGFNTQLAAGRADGTLTPGEAAKLARRVSALAGSSDPKKLRALADAFQRERSNRHVVSGSQP